MKNLDFLAIGDITTDAFIRLKEPSAHCHLDRENMELCVNFGDKIPYESVDIVPAVGNSPNAAVAAARLGLKSGLIANIGDDDNGQNCLAVLEKEKVSGDLISVHKKTPTNYHYVLWYEDDRTILVKHQKYEYKMPDIGQPKWVYLSSIGPATEKYHDEIADCLEKNPEVKLAFQPGTFQINLGAERLSRIYRRTDVAIINKKEAGQILKKETADIKNLLTGIASLGPKTVLVTDGPKGAYLFDGAGTFFMPPYPDPKPPYERTGAGDAYASTFVSALALGKNSDEAIRWASVNSMSVVQQIGAQRGLLSRAEISGFLEKAPPDFKPVAL